MSRYLSALVFFSANCVAQTPHNLVSDAGFESGLAGFGPNQAGTSAMLSQADPIEGAQSLVIGTRGYGDSVLWSGSQLQGLSGKRSSLFSVSMRMRSTIASRSKIQVCGLVDYADKQYVQKCVRVAGTVGDKGLVSVSVPLDNTRDIARVRVGIFQEGSYALQGVQVDNVFASLDGIAPPPPPAPAPVPEPSPGNLISDGGFESGTAGFTRNQDGTYANRITTGAIAGAGSLSIGMVGYGDSVLWSGREAAELSGKRSNLYTVSMRVRMATSSSSSLRICAMADYAMGGDASNCTYVNGSAGDKGIITVSLPLDASRDLDRVRLGLFQEGSAAMDSVLLDEASAVLSGITLAAPAPNPTPNPEPTPTPTPTPTPAPGGTAYPGYTYQLPTIRPFISLDGFDTNQSSAAFLRLKAQVDDVVRVTNAQPAGTTYAQLVAALNAGHYGYSAADSVLMYKLTGEVQYIQQAIRMADLWVRAENARIASGQPAAIAGDSYLEVGHYLEQVALAYDHGHHLLNAQQRSDWETYGAQVLYNVWNPNNASWGGVARPWSGWSVNDPGNNYYYSFLKATKLWALATQHTGWITFLQQQKFTQLAPFFSQLNGGGSREGTGYGTALGSLFEDYRYWKHSTGEDLAALSPHARDTIDYWIHATVPSFDYFGPIGDQARSSMPRMFDYQRKLVLEGVALARGSEAAQRGTWWLNRIKVTDGGSGSVQGRMRYNYNFRYDLLAQESNELAPTALSYDATGAGAVFARSDWSANASWLSFVAGVFDQSHAHQDQGAFTLYRNGWLAVTPNIYSRSGINQGVALHNVVRFDVNGAAVRQNYSASTKSVSDSGDTLTIAANLTPAYSSNAQHVASWTRNLVYRRSNHTVQVHDQCSVGSGVRPVWQVQLASRPLVQGDGSIVAGNLRIRPVIPSAPQVNVVDMAATSGEYSGGYRLELTAASGCEFVVELQAQ